MYRFSQLALSILILGISLNAKEITFHSQACQKTSLYTPFYTSCLARRAPAITKRLGQEIQLKLTIPMFSKKIMGGKGLVLTGRPN